MTIKEIHDDVQCLLQSDTGLDKIHGRQAKMAKVAESLNAGGKEGPLLRSRDAWFSTTQTDVMDKEGKINVQLNDKDIGYLSLDKEMPEKPFYRFHPKPNIYKALETERSKTGIPSWLWSGKRDAQAINTFIERCDKQYQPKEREIQWQLAAALTARNKGLGPTALTMLTAVTWNGVFHEVGVCINKEGKLGEKPGNIDLVVRRGNTPGKNGYLVFEVKKQKERNIEAALRQALRYATALQIEANENQQSCANYHAVFGATEKEALKIGAVAVLENSTAVKTKALRLLPQLWADRGESKIDRLGVLLYEFDRVQKKVVFWEWLPGWDAREPRAD